VNEEEIMSATRRFVLLSGFLGAAALGVSGTGAWWVGKGPPAAAADPGPAAAEVLAFGHADADPGVARLAPVQPGRVLAVPARDNQVVKAGDELLRLDDEPARLRLREARADLADAARQLEAARKLPGQHEARLAQQRAGVAAARHRLSAARQQHAYLESRQRHGTINDAEVRASADQIKALAAAVEAEEGRLTELTLIEPADQVARAEALVAAREAQRGQAEYALRECVLRAPADGTVLRVLASPGDVLAGQAGPPVVYFRPAGPLVVRAEVEQEFAARVAPGQDAWVQDDSGNARAWKGRVLRVCEWYTRRRSILQDPLQVNDVRTLECVIQPDPAQPLRIGQRMRVRIEVGGPPAVR
jgi:multidrug resistance efflux pump